MKHALRAECTETYPPGIIQRDGSKALSSRILSRCNTSRRAARSGTSLAIHFFVEEQRGRLKSQQLFALALGGYRDSRGRRLHHGFTEQG
jgi:hypothetical protein